MDESRKRKASSVLTIRRKADTTPTPVITFSEKDMRYEPPKQDELMPSRVGKLDVNVLDLNLDPKCEDEREGPLPGEDLKEVTIGPKPAHKTKIGTILAHEDGSHLVEFLWENRDVFAWAWSTCPGLTRISYAITSQSPQTIGRSLSGGGSEEKKNDRQPKRRPRNY
ncbi:hypothetical protein CR513_36389, partial [Mucuna pruriens]